jgi:hypothetical protein
MKLRTLFLAWLLLGCEASGGDCPKPEPLDYFRTGSYAAPGGEATDYYCTTGCSAVFAPHDGVDPLDMHLDLENNVAIISYTRDGKRIEERWRIASRSSR